MRTKLVLFLVLVVLGGTSMWYINYPAHEKRAENRIHKYMDAQGVNLQTIQERTSIKDTKLNRWDIFYTFQDEKDFVYEYSYDKTQDAVLLVVYGTTGSNKGVEIKKGMKYPPLTNNWVEFDAKGNIKLVD